MKKVLITCAVIFGIINIIACGGGVPTDDKGTENSSPATNNSSSETKTEEAPKNDVSIEFKNALKKAETYANIMNMSKKGIYDQLVSEYGEKFPADAAQYAIDNVKADWNQNALKKAKTYQSDMNMSTSAIKEQLVSENGEKFTAEEAQYAVDNLK